MKCLTCGKPARPGKGDCDECVAKALERLAAMNLPGVYFLDLPRKEEQQAPEHIQEVLQALRGNRRQRNRELNAERDAGYGLRRPSATLTKAQIQQARAEGDL